MNQDQAAVFDDIVAKGGRLGGPYEAYIRIPRFMRLNQQMGDYLRSTSLTPRLRLLAALLVIRHWGARFAWATNAKEAIGAGLGQQIVDAINHKVRPVMENATDQLVCDLLTELLDKKKIGDEVYWQAAGALGETVLTDLVVTVGFYGMVCATLVSFDIDPPANAEQCLIT